MKRLLTLFAVVLLVSSCRTDVQKADKLRLQNKFDEAAKLYQKAANEGNAYAKWRLSQAYSNGDGVDWSDSIALVLLKESANEGCEEANCDLARAYMFDWYDIGKDEEKGKQLMDSLVSGSENSYVLSIYARLLFAGNCYDEDKEKAMNILEKVKDKNNPRYLELMGSVYSIGTDNIDISGSKALEYYKNSYEKGYRYGAYRCASIYDMGFDDVEKNTQLVVKWLKKGVEANESNCMVSLANCYLSEDSVYADIYNPQKGIELLKKATKRGDGYAYWRLGYCYQSGDGVDKNDKKALECFQKSTKLKNAAGAFSLGYAYIEGIGCDKDVARGIEIWKQAVEYGSAAAANNLYCYYDGYWGGKRNKEESKKWLLKGAELGDAVARRNIAIQYYRGNHLFEKNDPQAIHYMKLAADAGDIEACKWMAKFYRTISWMEDPEKAKKYENMTIAEEDRKKKE